MFRHMLRRPGSKALGCAAAAAAAAAAVVGAGLGTAQAMADAEPHKLCTDKLACHRNVPPPRTPVVLVSCGSFNPPTIAHLRMFDLATHALAERGHDVWGCYMSPVADAYGKQGLAPVSHRLHMCSLAAAGTDNVMVDTWEATRPGYTRTLQVLQHVASSLAAYMQPQQADTQHAGTGSSGAGGSFNSDAVHAAGLAAAAAAVATQPAAAHVGLNAPNNTNAKPSSSSSSSSSGRTTGPSPTMQSTGTGAAAATGTTAAAAAAGAGPGSSAAGLQAGADAQASGAQLPRVMLLCGADLLGTINQPGVWKDPDVILQEHGIVCVRRAGTDVQELLQQPGTVLHAHRDRVIVVHEPVQNSISSSWVRKLSAEGQPVRYLVPDAVLSYIRQQGLYTADSKAAGAQHA